VILLGVLTNDYKWLAQHNPPIASIQLYHLRRIDQRIHFAIEFKSRKIDCPP
jgi:hypothetical protein